MSAEIVRGSDLKSAGRPGARAAGGNNVFTIYKQSQGKWTRMCTMIGCGLIVLLGGHWLFLHPLSGLSYRLGDMFGAESLKTPGMDTLISAIGATIFVLLGLYISFRVSYVKPSTGDFFIATEGEMKKVSWSSRQEIIGSTQVVIVTLIFLSVLLFVVDLAFMVLFSEMGVLKVFDIRTVFGLKDPETASQSLGYLANLLRGL